MRGRRGIVAGLVVLLLAAPAQPWGNGSSQNPDFRYYGVHDAIAHVAYEKLRAYDPEAAAFISHWFLPSPGGYGESLDLLNLKPRGPDNFLGYTDDPDSVLQDWCNHLYLVHPRPGHTEQCAPGHVASLLGQLRLNLTAWLAVGRVPCSLPEHLAAYNAGLMAHYVGDLSQWGHTDYTRKDHSHPPDDPNDRTYHGYYESQVWGSEGLRSLLDDQRARPRSPVVVGDPAGAVRGLALATNMPDGVTVDYVDRDGATVQVGSQYRAMLTGYVQAYDGGQRFLAMRGYTSQLWGTSMGNIARSVDLLADLYYTAWAQARATVPAVLPALPGTPGCPSG